MKVITPSIQILNAKFIKEEFYEAIERAGRTCYKSENKITSNSAVAFIRTLIKNGHEAMLEHAPSISIRFICDRGVSHEIVRHRLFSFAQESTRYVNYKDKDMEFILPCWFSDEAKAVALKGLKSSAIESIGLSKSFNHSEIVWIMAMWSAEKGYNCLIEDGWSPQQARSVLPNGLKTEIVVTGNVREWRHFFSLRTAILAHPQMREVANMAYDKLCDEQYGIPLLFEDITPYRE